MTAHDQWKQSTSDPLGLRNLEPVEPAYDGWSQIETALKSHHGRRQNWRRLAGGLAIAASLVLAVGLTLRNLDNPVPAANPLPDSATQQANLASVPVQDNINALIGMSQSMEEQVRKLRQETSSMPAESAIYVAELEDLIAQVDNELSMSPGSLDLWGQRVNLLLDLAQIYQQQWQTDYNSVASL